ncbi:leucine-rich repeat domain-containing protein [Teredinibacter turnerae]|uniref:leucine-rich repeat domain-containing protein n=1 Tax=Teredinibacter turnerae TaxID=2426 RepID=UPI000378631C|nr:leucine-rich repeat domain-containing protein [Teredinibacter turnerae]
MENTSAPAAHSSVRSLRSLQAPVCGLLLSFLLSCSQYEFTLNEKTLYDPTTFRRELSLKDKDLENCVKNVVSEQQITAARQVRQLLCGPGKILSLEGIEIFNRVQQLGLAKNTIENISSLASLRELRHINLADNAITDASVLDELKQLQYVDLSGNPELNCASTAKLQAREQIELLLPTHCRQE